MSRTKGHSLGPVVLLACAGLVTSIVALVMAYPLTRAAAAEQTGPEPVYAVRNLGTLGGGQIIARDINDAGQVVGQSQDKSEPPQNRAFLWEDGKMKDLGTSLKGTDGTITTGFASFGRGINNPTPERQYAQVVGFARTSSNPNPPLPPVHGFLGESFLGESDPMTDLGTLTEVSASGTRTTFSNSEAWHINDHGVAVGRAFNSGSRGRAVLWEDGQIKNLGTSLNTTYSEAWSINNPGQVVGEAGSADGQAEAFLYSKVDGPTNLDPLIDRSRFFSAPDDPSSYKYSEAMGINDQGKVVGWTYKADQQGKAFLYEREAGGTSTMVPLEPVAGKPYSRARDIDEEGRVVGWSRSPDGTQAEQFSATLWEDGQPTDLNDLIPADKRYDPANPKPGWKLTDAYAINEKDQIVGAGFYYFYDKDGKLTQSQLQAFLLTPDTTEPSLTVNHMADGTNGWNKTSPVTLDVRASDNTGGFGLEGDPTCKDGTVPLTLTAGTVGTWTANVSGEGTHSITCTVGDKAGNTKSATDTIRIDTLAPSVSCNVAPNELGTSANNHKLVDITASVTVSDSGSGADGFELVSVTSNQADSGLGPDDVPNDIRGWDYGTNDTDGQIRTERYRTERVYTLTYRGKDSAGNTRDCQATVKVLKGG